MNTKLQPLTDPVAPTATLEMLETLVGFPSVSRDSNLDLIEWCKTYLESLGFTSRLTYNDEGNKANLLATIGEQNKPGLVLSGHTDVVPVDGQNWDSDPFKLLVTEDRAYGRGTSDMKGFIAVLLAKAPKFAQANLQRPVHFALSFDEEVGCLGVRHMLEDMRQLPFRPSGCIIGEPSSMQIVVAHKGKRAYKCQVHGKEAHSSIAPRAVNAVEYAAELISFINKTAREFEKKEAWQTGFDIPFTTILTTLVNGGIATNVVPKDCEFTFEYRYLPGVDPDQIIERIREYATQKLLPEMHRVDSQTAIEFEQVMDYPGMYTDTNHELTHFMKRMSIDPQLSKVAFGTEGGLFNQAGIPSIICGPGKIDQAHKPNEYVELDQLIRCEELMDRLIVDLQK